MCSGSVRAISLSSHLMFYRQRTNHLIDYPVVEVMDSPLVWRKATGHAKRVFHAEKLRFGDCTIFVHYEIESLMIIYNDLVVVRPFQRRFRKTESRNVSHIVRSVRLHVLEPHAIEIGTDDGAWINMDVLSPARRWSVQPRNIVEPLIAFEHRTRSVGQS